MKSAPRPATYADVLAAPEHMVAEIVEGTLYTTPRPAARHAYAETMIARDLSSAFHLPPGDPAGPGGWWMLFEPELHLSADVVVPDIAGWRRERLAAIPDTPTITQAPDWVCEVVSPRTGTLDRGRKMRVYAREGVAHMWIVDPVTRTLEVYRLGADVWLAVSAHGDGDHVRVEPFDAIVIDLARWWLEPPAA
jgi:Uma2 family endonuclease